MKIEDIARICHEALVALCRSQRDNSQRPWSRLKKAEKQRVMELVTWRVLNLDKSIGRVHEHWCKAMEAAGWTYGAKKDAKVKTHPCLAPFDTLPFEQQAKAALLAGICKSLSPFLDWNEKAALQEQQKQDFLRRRDTTKRQEARRWRA